MPLDEDEPEFKTEQEAVQYWRSLARDLDAQLDDTSSALEEFQANSKELEDELEKDAARQKQLTVLVEQLQSELLEWKSKHQTALKDQANTLSHMQKELESVRASEQAYRRKVVDMELSNDDLEKTERALESTLQDWEAKYNRSIERAALLEEELVGKARLEEENQRLKDELRDANEEVSFLREQLLPNSTRPSSRAQSTPTRAEWPPEPSFPRKDSRSATPASSLLEAQPIPSTSATTLDLPDLPELDQDLTPRRPPESKPRPRSSISPAEIAKRSTHIPSPKSTLFRSESSLSNTLKKAASPDGALPAKRSTPRALREQRAQTMVSGRRFPRLALSRDEGVPADLKSMSDRVKMLTARVDARRQTMSTQPNARTSLPRPRRLSTVFPKTSSTPTANVTRRATLERRSIASPGSLEDELARASSPLARTMPRRPASRQSTVPRPRTPSFAARSPTPNMYKKPQGVRPPFGSSAPSGRLVPSASVRDLSQQASLPRTTRRYSVQAETPEEDERF